MRSVFKKRHRPRLFQIAKWIMLFSMLFLSLCSDGEGEEDPTSCRGRCGDRRNFPCSCTDICVVNGNCCWDIALECKHTMSAARSSLRHLFKAEVECSDLTHTFMVMSCLGQSSLQVHGDTDRPNPEDADNGESFSVTSRVHDFSTDADDGESFSLTSRVQDISTDADDSESFSLTSRVQDISTDADDSESFSLTSRVQDISTDADDSESFSLTSRVQDISRKPEDAMARKNLTETNNPLNSTLSSLKNRSSYFNAFLSLLMNAPVTDVTTEIVYRNRSVASCYGVLHKHMLIWKVQIALIPTTLTPRDLKGLNQIVDTEVYAYRPPEMPVNSSPGSGCIVHSISQCKAEHLINRPELESLCANGRTTYYNTRINGIQRVYKNIHCLACGLGSVKGSAPVLTDMPLKKTFKFSVLASLSISGNLTVLTDEKVNLHNWEAMECSLPTESHNSAMCRKSQCSKQFEKRPDGECRILLQVKFAVGANNCTFRRSQNLKNKMADVIKCYLETYENAELITENLELNTVYDTRLNISLLEFSGEAYYSHNALKIMETDKVVNMELAMLLYDADFCCGPPLPPAECSGNFCRLGEETVPSVTTVESRQRYKTPNLSQQDEPTRLIGENSTVFCESKRPLHPIAQKLVTPALKCYKGPFFKSKLSLYAVALNVSCFGDNFGEHVLPVHQWQSCSGTPGHSSCSSFSLHLVFHALLWTVAVSY